MSKNELSGSRWFASCWRYLERPADKMLRTTKERIFVDIPPRLVELGPGRGSNFAYYPPGTSVLAFEPNQHMHDALRDRAVDHDIGLEIRSDDFRTADLPDESEVTVVATLVLCSVGDVSAMVSAIYRVLKPGGRFMFVEHVDKEPGTVGHLSQRILQRPWRKVGDGCNLLPGTAEALEAAGFTSIDTTLENIGPGIDPTSRILWGTATK